MIYCGKQDRRVQDKLLRNGKFADDWTQLVTELHRRDLATSPVIELRLGFGMEGSPPVAQISVEQVEQFFSEVLPDPLPKDLQDRLDGLDQPNQTLERALTKLNWVVRQVFPEGGPSKKNVTAESNRGIQHVTSAMMAHLIDQTTFDKIADRFKEWRRDLRDDPRKASRLVTMFVCIQVFRHYEKQFKQIYDPGDGMKSEFFQSSLSRGRQVELMKVDPADAVSSLTGEMIEEQYAANPEIERLSRDNRDVHDLMRASMGFGPPRSGREGRSGMGGRSGFSGPGRPDNGGAGPPRNGPGGDRRRPPEDR